MDRKVTPEQELAHAKARLRAHAQRLDVSLRATRQVGTLLLGWRRPTLRYALAGAVLLLFPKLKRVVGERG